MKNPTVTMILFLICFALVHHSARAHTYGEGGHLIIHLEPPLLEMQFDLTTGEINKKFPLDHNDDKRLTFEEEQTYPATALIDYISSTLEIKLDGKTCDYDIVNHRLMQHGNGNYIRFLLNHTCQLPKYEISTHYQLLFEKNPEHRGTMHLTNGDSMIQMRFFSDQRQQKITLKKLTFFHTLGNFIWQGVWHIWIGLDHILFLGCLILPAVFTLRDRQWHAQEDGKSVFLNTVKIVTAFTIAHSITLTSAVLGWVPLPPSWITESIIALSVIVVALNCIFPRLGKELWGLTFAFGLIHGFGFANALLELSMPPNATTLALLAFNLGVELGQILIVSAVLPVLFYTRNFAFYQPVILRGGGITIVLLATVWFVERVADIELLGFV